VGNRPAGSPGDRRRERGGARSLAGGRALTSRLCGRSKRRSRGTSPKRPEDAAGPAIDGKAAGVPPEPADGLTDPDEVPEPPDEAITQPGDLWILGDHRLLCGDSSNAEDVDRLLDGAQIHLVNTDPPYNVRLMYSVAA